MTKKPGKKCKEQYFQLSRAVFESPALPVLSKSAFVCLFRIMLEYLRHGGKDNGRLPVTYKQFEEYGVHNNAVGPALHELEALGFIKITRGRGGNAEYRHPSLFWITFLLGGSYEFQQFKTAEEAEAAALRARAHARKKNISRPRKPRAAPPAKTTGETPTFSPVETTGEGANFPPAETTGTSRKDLSICGCEEREGREPAPSPAVVPAPRRGNGAMPEIDDWMRAAIIVDRTASSRTAELVPAFRSWAQRHGGMNGHPILERDVVAAFAAKGHGNHKSMLGVVVHGVRLKRQTEGEKR
jgi:hypothetical protein